ncbi:MULTISPECIES: recombination mediator RecR [unclassified Gemella]|uniref:recombination mediator RecR n=1 Tax=unclassified Gemella TaxID=2624949 RepID=UPI0010745075|nr:MULTISPECIES: recombination mediator RecR [unclassified Gemella]MBF0710627.1 recombination protein RecR [Gemella sp. GL1.1]MBF0746394.1 recombination protein RecR [Gemella sp. 19428wG2_WT2a]NYS27971.1 recombination protein RecR [Gemella sp. GL1]TFU60177.1 recombination protein RecR [Gemella sp. WT2a]
MQYPKPILDLISSYMKLPGIGKKTAVRMAFHTLTMKDKDIEEFSKALANLKKDLCPCSICHRINEHEVCNICSDKDRNESIICVVESDQDLMAMENTEQFFGHYHVLGGVISPMNGIGPNDINLRSLLERAKDPKVKEIILATNSTPEGEGTASFILRILQNTDIKVTRIAQGISFGSDLEFVDEMTLARALSARVEL